MKQSVVGGILFFLVANIYAPGSSFLPVAQHSTGKAVLLGLSSCGWKGFGGIKQEPACVLEKLVCSMAVLTLMAQWNEDQTVYTKSQIEAAFESAKRVSHATVQGEYSLFLAPFQSYVPATAYSVLRESLLSKVGTRVCGRVVSEKDLVVRNFAWVSVRDLCASLSVIDSRAPLVCVRRLDVAPKSRMKFIPLEPRTASVLRVHMRELREL